MLWNLVNARGESHLLAIPHLFAMTVTTRSCENLGHRKQLVTTLENIAERYKVWVVLCSVDSDTISWNLVIMDQLKSVRFSNQSVNVGQIVGNMLHFLFHIN